MSKVRIILMRHGETVWHSENRFAGSSDIELTERGLLQAEALAKWARSAGLKAIYSSPLRRAIATAEPTAHALSLPLHLEDRLRELHFGQGEGLTHEEMHSRFPIGHQEFQDDPVNAPLPDGEPPRQAIARAQQAVYEIAAAALSPRQMPRILIIFHSTLIRLLLCELLGLNPSRYRQLFPKLGNVALTEVQVHFNRAHSQPEISLLTFNAQLESIALSKLS
jgi:probable phosphoglycerate mutase